MASGYGSQRDRAGGGGGGVGEVISVSNIKGFVVVSTLEDGVMRRNFISAGFMFP